MKERLFLDTNVILDLLGERDPFYNSAAKLVTLAERQKVIIVVSPLSFATLNYFLSKFENPKAARDKLGKFRVLCEVCSLNEQIIDKALSSSFGDFEDAIQYLSAIDSACSTIITRNAKDFKKSVIPVMSADEFLSSLQTR